MCVDKTKEKLNSMGISVIKVDTIVSGKVYNTDDSVICVVCKTNKGYYVTESFTYQDSIKQFKLLASGDKEHCMYYVNYGLHGKN
jgi:hypothetical protein